MIKINHRSRLYFSLIPTFLFCLLPVLSLAQENPDLDRLKEMSVEELMNIEVTSVSKRPEKLAEVASAIQVITQADIRRSAATTLPEVLRLSPNLQVSQINSQHWIISARGFNATFSNKLLVMIDGRTVYSPLFAGVFWDVQNLLLEDIERIEIISGPGGALWGANAVNGVINIITKNARDSQGLYLSGTAGNVVKDLIAGRYGGKIGSDLSYRLYAQHNGRNPTILANGQDNVDESEMLQGGFQLNWDPSETDNLLLQGNTYTGKTETAPVKSATEGQNILSRWYHAFSDKSDITFQMYFDRSWRRDIPSTLNDKLATYDFDFQHHFSAGKKHNILWGAGYRFMRNEVKNSTPFVGFVPQKRDMDLFSGFIQDEISIAPDKWKLTIGTKLQHNDFSGFDLQPSARLAFMPNDKHTLWSAVSRAVRAPSRIDVDYRLPTYTVPPSSISIRGIADFDSEKLTAYETGYRFRPNGLWLVSVAAFYNIYDDVYSIDSLPGTKTLLIRNGTKGHSYGVELSADQQLRSWWKLRWGYNYFHKSMGAKPGSNSLLIALSNLGIDARNRVLLQSAIDLSKTFQFDITARHSSALPASQYSLRIPAYTNMDIRLAAQTRNLEFSVGGQNLLEKRRPEFGAVQISRSFYGKVICRF